MGPMGNYRIFGADGVQMGGMMDKPENIVSGWGFYINVDGIDAAAERIKANGGQVLMGPHEVPGGSWIVQAMDPQGAAFARLHHPLIQEFDMSKISPCLWFDGQAEEAAQLYTSLIPDSRIDSVNRAPADYPSGSAATC